MPKKGIIMPDMGMTQKNISLETVLFSKVQRCILALFFTHAEESFYTNEIIRLVNAGSGVVQRELKKFTLAGLLTIQKMGNQKRYQANHASPIFSDLQNIVVKTFGLANLIQNALAPIAKQIHIGFIYGSIANHTSTAESDIDLMLLSDKLSYSDVFPLLEDAGIQLQRSINPTIYSPKDWTRKIREGNNFLNRVMEQPKIFIIGNENELGSFS